MGNFSEELKMITISDPVFPASGTLVYQTHFNTVETAFVVGISGLAVSGSPYMAQVESVSLATGAYTNSISLTAFDTASGTLEAFTGTLSGDINLIVKGV